MGELQNIVVVPYDPAWRQMYRQEAAAIAAILPDLIAIHHIGSTSIPELSAKPIIDILVLVPDIERGEAFHPAMMQLGYEPQGEYGIPGRRLFFKGSDEQRTHHVHMYGPGHPEVTRLLYFRDYLIAHPVEAERYGRLKTELARQFPRDISGYRAGKAPLVIEIIRKAHEWHKGQTSSKAVRPKSQGRNDDH